MGTLDTDMEMISRYREGCLEALEQLVRKYRRQLYGFIVNMTGSSSDADDIFQEVWFKALKKLDAYTEKNFLGWLMKIARNTIIDRFRGQKPIVSLDAEQDEGRSRDEMTAGPDRGPRRRLENREIGKKIAAAVESLPPEQKEVFLLRVEADLPFKEICAIQGTSINTALGRMQYALAKLRSLLKDEYAELGDAR